MAERQSHPISSAHRGIRPEKRSRSEARYLLLTSQYGLRTPACPKHRYSTRRCHFDELAEAIKGRRSVYGYISGLRLDRGAPGEAWSSLPYRPVFVGDTKTGVLHGGVVTAMPKP